MHRRAVLLGLLAVAGCGFTPAYQTGGVGTKLQGAVALPDPDTVEEYALNGFLTQRLGQASSPRFKLEYQVQIAVVDQAITSKQVTTRYSLNGTVRFRLIETASGNVASQGAVSAFTSYSATGSTIATSSAQTDARLRLMNMLADQLVTRLLGTVAA